MNVRGAFTVSDPAVVDRKHVLLIDDIFTTGATARAAAQALLQAGAASVWVATLARAGCAPGSPPLTSVHLAMRKWTSAGWPGMRRQQTCKQKACIHRTTNHLFDEGKRMSLGKAMIHARKQKSIARAAACAGDHALAQSHSARHILQMPVLVLNASYEPINICGARRALVLVLKGIARTEEEHGLILHAQRSRIAMPSVIRLLEYRRIPHQTRALSRKNILLRDRNTCQYCGVVLPSGELTLDHVIPRSRGGNSTWENLVACCHDCNRRKGNRLLHEIDDMILLREPRPFSLHTSRQIMRMLGRGDDRWRKYLFY